ncbi:TPA: hypothetical protein ACGQK4_002188 [Elizabethkingia anophelis]|nr:hypothetical protein [Elizabethkingia anophelis]
MENKLVPMTEFVLSILNNTSPNNFVKGVESIRAYAEFLKQPLELWMFIPCDENNVPLMKPDYLGGETYKRWNDYDYAKSRVLFEGFEIEQSKSRIGFYLPEYNCIDYSIVQNNFSSPSKYLTTIEDLIIYSGLTLTETAIKQIYGS